MSSDFLVLVEMREGRAKKASLEALGEARRLAEQSGASAHAVVLGKGAARTAPELRGVGRAFIAEGEPFERFHLAEAAGAVLAAARRVEPAAVLLAATPTGREVAAAVAAELRTSVAADATRIEWRDGTAFVTRPVYAGKATATVRFRRLPAVISLRPNVFAPLEGGAPPREVIDVGAEVSRGTARVVEVIEPEVKKQDLAEADVIVSGGRGLKGPENFGVIESLARTLGGAVGASRAVCDAGWRPHSEQVGQTGKTVSPRLYIACGISGAVQHLAGMSSSKTIVAINKDPNAPIFGAADYGIVGDLFEVVPQLEAEIKRQTGS